MTTTPPTQPAPGSVTGRATLPAEAPQAGTADGPLSWSPFPVEALPEPVATFIAEGAAGLGCDSAYVALPTLAVLGAAIGNSFNLELRPGWVEPAIVWSVIIGDSGTMKSPALDLALKPLDEVEREWLADFADRDADYVTELEMFDKQLTAWRHSGDMGPPPEEPAQPTCQRIVCADTTVAALGVLLSENPRGLLLARDELNGWLASLSRNGNSDASHFLALHGARPLRVDRKTGKPPRIYVPRASLCITGAIQPPTLVRALGSQHVENGLAARLLMAMPPSRQKQWSDDGVPESVRQPVSELITDLLEHSGEPSDDGVFEPVTLTLADAGRHRWREFYNDLAAVQSQTTSTALRAAYGKLEAYGARLTLVDHLCRTRPEIAHTVDQVSVDCGTTLASWFAQETARVYKALGTRHEDDAGLVALIERLRANGGTMSPRELQRTDQRRFSSSTGARSELDRIVQAGYGRWSHSVPSRSGGRPTERVELESQRDTTTPAHPVEAGTVRGEEARQ